MGNTSILEQNIESIAHIHGDVAYQAESLAEAMKLCPVLGGLALEDAQLLMDAMALGQKEIDVQDAIKSESEHEQRISTDVHADEIVPKPTKKPEEFIKRRPASNVQSVEEDLNQSQAYQTAQLTKSIDLNDLNRTLFTKPSHHHDQSIENPAILIELPKGKPKLSQNSSSKNRQHVLKSKAPEPETNTLKDSLGTFPLQVIETTQSQVIEEKIDYQDQQTNEIDVLPTSEPPIARITVEAPKQIQSTSYLPREKRLDIHPEPVIIKEPDLVSEVLVLSPLKPSEEIVNLLYSDEEFYDETSLKEQDILETVVSSLEQLSEDDEALLQPMFENISHLVEEIVTAQHKGLGSEHLLEATKNLENVVAEVLDFIGISTDEQIIEIVSGQMITRCKQITYQKNDDESLIIPTVKYMHESKNGPSSYSSNSQNERDVLSLLIGFFTVLACTQTAV